MDSMISPNSIFLLGFVVIGLGVLLILFLVFIEKVFITYHKASIMTPAELRFYKVLIYLLPTNYILLCQVRLANIVSLPANAFLWKNFTPLGAKCVDFVICERESGKTILVIELDDSSHLLAARKKRDKFIDSVLKKASIPILHQKVVGYYDNEELKKAIQYAIQKYE